MSSQSADHVVRIGGGSAYFADSALGVPQLLAGGNLDYLVFDYLAEASMGMLGLQRKADPTAAYPPDFLNVHVGPYLAEIAKKGIKIVANAGALDPRALAREIEALLESLNLSLAVAAVSGDDLTDRVEEFRSAGMSDMFSGAPLPESLLTCNAYLGAYPIAEALDRGADIVVTGRIVDSAIVLGPLIHEFGWKHDDYDLLAAGTLAGHLLECSTQITGGTFTDWEIVEGWETIGFPIGECSSDGSVIITKPDGTGGLVSRGTVAEQLLYEVSNPADYIVADVCCDFSDVEIEEVGPDRVRVKGAKGRPPSPYLKVSATTELGWRTTAITPFVGKDAGAKARRQGKAQIARARTLLNHTGLPEFTATSLSIFGDESAFGPDAPGRKSREVVMKLTADHATMQGAGLFAREQASGITTMACGTGINLATTVLPLTGVFAFLLDRSEVEATVTLGDESWTVPNTDGHATEAAVSPTPKNPASADALVEVELRDLAWTRSGDKGNLFNVAVIARRPEFLPWIASALSEEAVSLCYDHISAERQALRVERFHVPGIHALNFVVHASLNGGILKGTGFDPAAKGMGQFLLSHRVSIPEQLKASLSAERRQAGDRR